MTLAVARIANNRVAIAADTLVTEHDQPLPRSRGIIKSCMLPGDICVTFSNSPELAAQDFDRFSRLHPDGLGFSETLSFFERSSINTGNDYLLAFSRAPRLAKIANGQRTESVSKTLWIGDAGAYQRFREVERDKAKRQNAGRAINAVMFMDEIDKSPASDLFSVMREVVADKSVESVGGFVSLISNRDPGFRYSVYSDMLFNWPKDRKDDYIVDLNEQIDFGASGENFEYAVAQISPGYLGLNMVAFYLLKAKKIFFFFGLDNGLPTECRVLSDVPPSNIASRLSEAVGFDARWLLTIMAAAPNRTDSVNRLPLRTDGPSGVGFSMQCHANTFPPTGNKLQN